MDASLSNLDNFKIKLPTEQAGSRDRREGRAIGVGVLSPVTRQFSFQVLNLVDLYVLSSSFKYTNFQIIAR